MVQTHFYDNDTLIDEVVNQKQLHPVLKDKAHLPYQDAFIKEFYQNISEEDIKKHDSSDLYALALTVLEFTKVRQKGKPKIRIYHPSKEHHGVEIEETILEVISDDKPFIIDSLIEALNKLNLHIKLLIHPIFSIERDQNDEITSVASASGKGGNDESVVQIRFDKKITPTLFNTIIDNIKATLSMVDLAVKDWQTMVQKMDTIIEETKKVTLKDKKQLKESVSFLEWLQQNNFIYLGCQE